MTKHGPSPIDKQIVYEQKVERGEEGKHVSQLVTSLQHDRGKLTELNVQRLYVKLGVVGVIISNYFVVILRLVYPKR